MDYRGLMTLRALSAYQPAPYQPRIVAVAGLVVAAVLYACSMPLQWVGVVTVSGAYVIVDGLRQANWLLLIAVMVIGLAVCLYRVPPGGFSRFAFLVINLLVLLGLCSEYFDNISRAEGNAIKPYLGPGFFLALAVTGVLIAATILGWNEQDNWQDGQGADLRS
jgi:hypothetical protein